MGKSACITRIGAVRNFSTNIIMEKEQTMWNILGVIKKKICGISRILDFRL